MELYEGAESILSAEKVVDVIRGNTRRPSFSAYTARTPSVSRQTMVFPHAVRSMKVTQTRYGVTLRNILMGLGSDQVRVQNPSACLPEHGHSTATFVLLLLRRTTTPSLALHSCLLARAPRLDC